MLLAMHRDRQRSGDYGDPFFCGTEASCEDDVQAECNMRIAKLAIG
jgi:hypothetical protein